MTMDIELIPIREHLSENGLFTANPDCQESIYMSVDFYKKVGYELPWICYYAAINGELVGSAAFKGKPIDGKVEIAYGTFPARRQSGVGTAICSKLVQLALDTDPALIITARTLPEENYSTRILGKNNFVLTGTVSDPEDGEVWEWEYRGA